LREACVLHHRDIALCGVEKYIRIPSCEAQRVLMQSSAFRHLMNVIVVMTMVLAGSTAAGERAHGFLHAVIGVTQAPPCHNAPAPARDTCQDLCARHAPAQTVESVVVARGVEAVLPVMVAATVDYRAAVSPAVPNTGRWSAPPGASTPVYLRHLRLLI
jgi:hypothetical protein